MRIKVCGMTRIDQVEQLSELGATFAGFIFYPKSPRYVYRYLSSPALKKLNMINKVGVFVNAPVEEVLATVDECRLHMVQLHGDESPKYCEKIADYVSVVKAFRLSDNDSIEWMVNLYQDVCDMFMFDTMGAGYGGTGKKFDWKILSGKTITKPFFLSGGIHPDDTAELLKFRQDPVANALFAVDINSHFETAAGIKDLQKVGKFINELKQ